MGWRVVWYHREGGNCVALVAPLKRVPGMAVIFLGDSGVEYARVDARESRYMRDGVPGRRAKSPRRAARAFLRLGRSLGIGKRARKLLRRVAGVDNEGGGE